MDCRYFAVNSVWLIVPRQFGATMTVSQWRIEIKSAAA